jgi:acylphosphatase
MPICKRCIVAGVVQGVYFRGSAQRQAKSLGVTGWVRNLSDGRLEVFACGEPAQVQDFIRWLWIGPPRARVHHIITEHADVQDMDDFDIR